jgi:hypothetical protein
LTLDTIPFPALLIDKNYQVVFMNKRAEELYPQGYQTCYQISHSFSEPKAVLKIPYRDVSPASKGTNLLLTLSHAPSTNAGFRGDKSLGRIRPRIGKRRATFRTCQAEEEALLLFCGKER